ncbi:MAG: ABC transporter permease [Actinobacteria bacterium]|nr:ABC transporter permease [Actinomycetota bacterium]
MWRRKLRSALTVFGIVIGIFAFTVMGSMAEKINLLISGAVSFYGTAITVQGKGGGGFGGAFTTAVVEELRALPGVAEVQPSVITLLRSSSEGGGFSFGPPNLLAGVDISEDYLRRFSEQGLVVAKGSNLAPGDTGVVVVGSDIADEFNLAPGSTFRIRGEDFVVKGVLQRSLQFADKITTCAIEDARRVFTKDLPLLLTDDIVTSAQVYAAGGIDADALARQISDQIPDVRAVPPSELKRQFQAGTVIFNLIIFGVALIAVIVGGLSVINTMIMSVSERTREIGIKRAVGAKTHHIMAEYLGEASLIGLLGGLIGFGLGWATTLIINSQTQDSGTILFTMTWRLALGALLFSVGLGVVAGLYPAFRAARMDPVKALRTM